MSNDALRPSTAMIFAAGLGTRMRPLTLAKPKPLIEVGGKALIDYMLDLFAQAGLNTAIVNVHYLADQIESHLCQRQNPQLIFSDERECLLDQGGGIKKALPHLQDEAFFICNTDAFWLEGPQSNIARLAAHWMPRDMDALLLLAPCATSIGVEGKGDFHIDAQGRLTRRNENQSAPFVYTGVGIIKTEFFRHEPRDIFPLAPLLFDIAAQGRLYGLRLDGLWMHVGTPDAIIEAEEALILSLH
jgi:N-acetyl-alpha-D-muramate 1-phosphate uridylyltransferase